LGSPGLLVAILLVAVGAVAYAANGGGQSGPDE
jgi:hypothetical protein